MYLMQHQPCGISKANFTEQVTKANADYLLLKQCSAAFSAFAPT